MPGGLVPRAGDEARAFEPDVVLGTRVPIDVIEDVLATAPERRSPGDVPSTSA
jgi:hypothetical protein